MWDSSSQAQDQELGALLTKPARPPTPFVFLVDLITGVWECAPYVMGHRFWDPLQPHGSSTRNSLEI